MPKIHLTMPQPGETITEGVVVRWIVQEGENIFEGQPLVELETEKAVFEYESPFEGKLLSYLVKAQAIVPVGNPIALFEVSEEKAKHYQSMGIATPPAANSVGANPCVRPIFSPYVRSLLKKNEIDENEIKNITTTGPRGRMTKEDILSYLRIRKEPSKNTLSTHIQLIPCSPVRLRIAENMILSKNTIPHAHTGLSVDVTPLVIYRERLKEDFWTKHHISLGYLTLILPALKRAIQAYPLVNASYRAESLQIAVFKEINLGVAVDTERGLYTPVIPNIGPMSFIEFAKKLEILLEKAKKNHFSPNDLTDMTFTFNNFGYFGTSLGVQVVPPSQSSILGMGRIEKRPWVYRDQIEIRYVAEFVLAFDHRVMDGREAGLFLQSLKKDIESFSDI